jgi:hypothetical protein
MTAASALHDLLTAEPAARRYNPGDMVEVYDIQQKIWLLAFVDSFWTGIHLDTGERFVQIGVSGQDDKGPFYGRFDPPNVRPAAFQ